MTVRERIAQIHQQQLRGTTTPTEAAQWLATLGALVGNVLDEKIAAQVMRRVEITDGCWLWTGCQDGNGYGMVRVGGKHGRTKRVHRALWEAIYGDVPEGLTLDHLCRVRHCVNPAHLEPVTPIENTMRGFGVGRLAADRTHCDKGHPFDGDNLRIHRRKDGRFKQRVCRACDRERVTAWKRAHRSRRIA